MSPDKVQMERPTGRAPRAVEKQVTAGPGGRILTNVGVWSPDGQWLVYDTRSDAAGDLFDGRRIERVHVETGEVQVLYTAKNGACCGVATYHPQERKVVFIHGPENPTPDWAYGPTHRRGVVVDEAQPGVAVNLDARDLTTPFIPGALRGGSHVHVFSPDGQWVSFTYQDHLLAAFAEETDRNDFDLRNIGISIPVGPVVVDRQHPRNHDGSHFSVLVTRTTARPAPGSDQIKKACEEGWVGTRGYVRPDGSRQPRALAFQGQVMTPSGQTITEVFIADLPDNPTTPGNGPLSGTETRRPFPPKGVAQRRLTHTADHKFPGLQGPRHWLRSSPDGARIAFLMKDDQGIVQLWTVSPNGGAPVRLTGNPWDIGSAFTWSPDGRFIAHVMDNSVAITDTGTGETMRLTGRYDDAVAPRPEACVFSPEGARIAYVRRMPHENRYCNQLFVLSLQF